MHLIIRDCVKVKYLWLVFRLVLAEVGLRRPAVQKVALNVLVVTIGTGGNCCVYCFVVVVAVFVYFFVLIFLIVKYLICTFPNSYLLISILCNNLP